LSTSIPNNPQQWTTYEYCLGNLLDLQSNYLSAFGTFLFSYKTNFEGYHEYFADNFHIEIRD